MPQPQDYIIPTIKQLLQIPPEYDVFDMDILIHVNSVFSTLHQLGVGPEAGFAVSSHETLWTAFLEDAVTLENVKTYVYLRVKLLFDPPSHAFVTTAIKDQIQELEWRLTEQAAERKVSQNGT